MLALHIIVPVKNSLDTTLDTLESISLSGLERPWTCTVYDDFSEPSVAQRLNEECARRGFEIIHLEDLTSHPSPNYLLVLQHAQSLVNAAPQPTALLIVESDVTLQATTLERMAVEAERHPNAGIIGAATVDADGRFNYPYAFAEGLDGDLARTNHHLSFCCSLLTARLLKAVDFQTLNPEKNWFDVTISHLSRDAGLENLVLRAACPLHRPHGSRPWKQLKYKNPLLYYFRKLFRGMDKI